MLPPSTAWVVGRLMWVPRSTLDMVISATLQLIITLPPYPGSKFRCVPLALYIAVPQSLLISSTLCMPSSSTVKFLESRIAHLKPPLFSTASTSSVFSNKSSCAIPRASSNAWSSRTLRIITLFLLFDIIISHTYTDGKLRLLTLCSLLNHNKVSPKLR